MVRKEKTVKAFFALVRGGLWEQDVQIQPYGEIDFNEILRLAEEQAVVGLVTAGLEHVSDIKVPKEVLLQFIGQTIQLEQRNTSMNGFIEETIEKLRKADIYTLLVKGQGIAQCYERPHWRASGDIDLFLSRDNYDKAKAYFLSHTDGCKPERQYSKELGLSIDSWFVELHGTQRTGLSTRIDTVVDEVQRDVFYNGNVRSWQNGKTQVFLPSADNDVILVFTHLIKHFYKGEGVSLRQICDWIRLLWTYRDSINVRLLESRIKEAGLKSEWKAFSYLATNDLGMPVNAIPFYDQSKKWARESNKILEFIISSKNSGRFKSALGVFNIFPINAFLLLPGILFDVTWLKVKEKLLKPIQE